jgi:hypothetical protein
MTFYDKVGTGLLFEQISEFSFTVRCEWAEPGGYTH